MHKKGEKSCTFREILEHLERDLQAKGREERGRIVQHIHVTHIHPHCHLPSLTFCLSFPRRKYCRFYTKKYRIRVIVVRLD